MVVFVLEKMFLRLPKLFESNFSFYGFQFRNQYQLSSSSTTDEIFSSSNSSSCSRGYAFAISISLKFLAKLFSLRFQAKQKRFVVNTDYLIICSCNETSFYLYIALFKRYINMHCLSSI